MVELLHIDCMEYMKNLPDKAFDIAVVDPPYGINISKWDKQIPTEKYFNELFRTSKNQIIWGGNFFELPPTKCYIVWNKKTFLTIRSTLELAWTSFAQLPNYLEYSYCGNYEGFPGKAKVDYTKKSIHPTQKPKALYKWLYENYCKPGWKILDTHLGSGSSAIVAHKMGFDFVGCEIDKDYYDAAIKRFNKEIAMPLFEQPELIQSKLF